MINPRRQAVIDEARSWIGTPFLHQARVKGAGVDCLNLIWAVGEATGEMLPVTKEAARPFWRHYGRRPNPPKMRECLSQFLVEIPAADVLPGDIAWSHWGNDMPIHMSLVAEFDGRHSVIHAVWPTNVSEATLGAPFRERVTAWWRYPGLAEAYCG